MADDERAFPDCACDMRLESCNLDNPNCPRFHDATWHEMAFGLWEPWEPVSLQEMIAEEERYNAELAAETAYRAQLPPMGGDGPLPGEGD